MPDEKEKSSKTDKSKETRHAAYERGATKPAPEERTFQGGASEKKG